MKKTVLGLSISILLSILTGMAAATDLVEMKRFHPGELKLAGFELNKSQKIEIEATGLWRKDNWDELSLGRAWILNAATREVVWEMEPAEFSRHRLKAVEQKSRLDLSAGIYEAYYSSYPYLSRRDDWSWSRGHYTRHLLGEFFDWLFDRDGDDWREHRRLVNDFKLIVRGEGKALDREKVFANQKKIRGQALFSLVADRDDYFRIQGFELTRPTELEIYAQGEARDDGNFDYGWIINLDNREKVWKMDFWDSDDAGGAEKNRMVKETISLPKGRYAAYYITDDSHSPEEWNSAPPYDPWFWGLTVRGKKSDFRAIDYNPFNKDRQIVSLGPARDDDFLSAGFSLKKPMKIRVYALGEGHDDEMFDYGWIVDASNHKRVWEMDFDETEHAGGGQKNRLFDGIIELDRGNYMVYYITDDSHSYHNWNASPPYDPQHWGISLFAAGEKFSRSDVADYQMENDPSLLVDITRVRDDQFKREHFKLDKDSRVRVYALGEGMNGEMYDYAWIEESASGKVVWEMTYRKTHRAGGARKNRLFDDTILLKKGEYTVFYESDDSHSFNSWNDRPPYDPQYWGISIYLADNK